MTTTARDELVRHLYASWRRYEAALAEVVAEGSAIIPTLVSSLHSKHSDPIAEALGRLAREDAITEAVPALLGWLTLQSPMYRPALEALVRIGDKALPMLRERLEKAAADGDEEAVAGFLHLAGRQNGPAREAAAKMTLPLLTHRSPPIRESAVVAIDDIGLPFGAAAIPILRGLESRDPVDLVRTAAREALLRLVAPD